LVMELMSMPSCFQQNHRLCWDYDRCEIWWIQRLSTRES
jgi:hypothetical protein